MIRIVKRGLKGSDGVRVVVHPWRNVRATAGGFSKLGARYYGGSWRAHNFVAKITGAILCATHIIRSIPALRCLVRNLGRLSSDARYRLFERSDIDLQPPPTNTVRFIAGARLGVDSIHRFYR